MSASEPKADMGGIKEGQRLGWIELGAQLGFDEATRIALEGVAAVISAVLPHHAPGAPLSLGLMLELWAEGVWAWELS